jgi:acetyltransferase-like isoleucine patch superfamily enzyme
MTPDQPIVLFAAQSIFAHEVAESLLRLDIKIAAAIVTGNPEWDMTGLEPIIAFDDMSDELCALPVIVPNLVPGLRKRDLDRAVEAGFGSFPPIVDPTAIVAKSAVISPGIYINAGVVIGAGVTLEPHSLVNRAASIGHHSRIRQWGTIGPGAHLSSRCLIGEGAMIGAGAALAPGRRVGKNAVAGTGAAVLRDVADNTLVLGNPARVSKGGIKGYAGSGV